MGIFVIIVLLEILFYCFTVVNYIKISFAIIFQFIFLLAIFKNIQLIFF